MCFVCEKERERVVYETERVCVREKESWRHLGKILTFLKLVS